MKTLVIYNSETLDGLMSAAIVRKYMESNNITNVFYVTAHDNYDLKEYYEIYIIGKVLSIDVLIDIINTKKVHWIDNNKFQISEVSSKLQGKIIPGNRDMIDDYSIRLSLCELTWKYLFEKSDIPKLVSNLGAYESLRYTTFPKIVSNRVADIYHGARAKIYNIDTAFKYLNYVVGNPGFDRSINIELSVNGEDIFEYAKIEAIQFWKYKKIVEKNGIKMALINKYKFNPSVYGIDYKDIKIVMSYFFDGQRYKFSIYTEDDNIDCSIIAKQFGGNGNKKEAEFELSTEHFKNFMI